ncbi:MAG: DUF4982 domain-containing protein [Planctomycetota bacterium]
MASEPLVYITSRRHVERDDPNTPVKVYSNCGTVELLVNGQTMGSVTGKGCIFKWPEVRLKEGLNRIEAIATPSDSLRAGRDGKTYTERCEWNLSKGQNR